MKTNKSDNKKDKKNKPDSEMEKAAVAERTAHDGKRSANASGGGKRWTMVDTVIVLMVLLAVVGVVIRGAIEQRKETAVPAAGPVYVSFSVAEIHPTVLGEVQAFDPLYLYDTDVLLGYMGVYDDGSLAMHITNQSLSASSLYVAAEGSMVCLEGVYQNGGLLVSGSDVYLTPGAKLLVRTDRVVMTVEITEIRVNE